MSRKVGSKWTVNARKSWIEYRTRRFNNTKLEGKEIWFGGYVHIENSSTTICDKRVPEGESDRICCAQLSSVREANENA